MNDPEPLPRAGDEAPTIEPPLVEPPTAAPTRDFLETPGLRGATDDVRRSPGHAPRNAPTIPGYEILDELGRGGMGVVYKARQLGLKRFVALKMIRARSGDARALARFRAEAAAAARLQHPHIVQVYEIGERDDEPYFALEYLAGGSLAARLGGAPQPPRASAELIETLARAVHAAHEKGIVHRDLKPANILLDAPATESSRTLAALAPTAAGNTPAGGFGPAGGGATTGGAQGASVAPSRSSDSTGLAAWGRATPKIADFGIAKHLASEDEGEPAALRTETGAILGTPSYMAPEQAAARSDLIGPPTDVYALGAILYELLVGKPPFLGPTAIETVNLVLNQEPTAPRKFVARTPRDLETICLKCLEKSRSRRYASALELAEDLKRFLDGEPILARPTTVLDRVAKWSRKRPAVAASVVAAVVATVVSIAAGWWIWDSQYRVKVEHYHSFVMLSGRPVGAGPLSAEDVKRRALSYRFTRRGGRLESVELVNGLGRPTKATSFFNVSTILGEDDDEEREASFAFATNDDGDLLETTARDAHGDFLWRLHYTTPEMAHYTDARGFPRARSASGATYVKFTKDESTGVVTLRYLDRNGAPRCNSQKVFGAAMEFDDRGLLTKITYLGRDDRPSLHKQGMAKVVCRHDDRGRMVELRALDPQDRPAMINWGFSSARLSYDEHGNWTRIEFFGPDGKPRRQVGGFSQVSYVFNDVGLLVRQTYQDPEGKPATAEQGRAGEAFTHDEFGRTIETTCLGTDGRPILNEYGVARQRVTYDEKGRPLEERFYDLAGAPTRAASGTAGVRWAYDSEGRTIEETSLAPDGRPTTGSEGYATARSEYDAAGNRVRVAYFDADGKPTRHSDGEASVAYTYDDQHKLVEESYRDVAGRLTSTQLGYARVEQKYDEDGNVIEWKHWDADGGPARNEDGAHRVTAEYDDRRNKIGYRAFGPDLQPTTIAGGYSRWRAEYDPFGNEIRRDYFDAAGKPTLCSDGYARQEAAYDLRNSQTEVRYYGVDGRPLGGGAVARVAYERDETGRLISETNFDAEGKPATDAGGRHRTTYAYDARGLELERRYFGADGKPTPYVGAGNAIWRRKYDELGRTIEDSYHDGDGRPIDTTGGYSVTRYTLDAWGRRIAIQHFAAALGDAPPRPIVVIRQSFDERGNQTGWAAFTPAGEPTTWDEPAHRVEYAYDSFNRRLETRRYATDGRPLEPPDAAVVRYTNDDLGRAIAIASFDAEGRPIADASGVHREEKTFDAIGREVERRYFAPDGSPARFGVVGNSIWRKKHDALGRVAEESYYDADGRLMNLFGTKYAIVRYVRDAWGNAVETRYFDASEKPSVDADGCHVVHSTYDVRGHWTATWAFDADGKPTPVALGVHRKERVVDARGRARRAAYFDADGKPTLNESGVHAEESEFDAAGREIERRYLDVAGKPARFGQVGNAMWRKKYDDRGRLVEESYYDADGKLMNLEGGEYAMVRYVRDAWNNAIETRYFDVEGKPTGGSDGIFVLHAKYDLRGYVTSLWAEGTDLRPTPLADGSYRRDRELDERGRVRRQRFFDADGKPTRAFKGCHLEEGDWDDEGNLIDLRWFDVDGKPLPIETVVGSVTTDGRGDRIGLQPGDVYVSYDGEPVGCRERILARRRAEADDDPPRRLVWRRGTELHEALVEPGPLDVYIENRVAAPPAAEAANDSPAAPVSR